jgi:hypothetical protein
VGILVVLLVAAWGLVLGPALLQSASSPVDTERMFRRSLRALGPKRRAPMPMGGRNILVPPKPVYPMQGQQLTPLGRPMPGTGRMTAADRRRRNLTYLAAFNIVTFVIGLMPPMRFILIGHLVGDALLILYVALAVYMANFAPQSRSEGRVQTEVVPRVAEGGF